MQARTAKALADALSSPAKLLDRFGMTRMPSEQVRKMLGRAGRLAAASVERSERALRGEIVRSRREGRLQLAGRGREIRAPPVGHGARRHPPDVQRRAHATSAGVPAVTRTSSP